MNEGPFLCSVQTTEHHWFADEPRTVGGEDLGPTPYEQLLAALGTCTSMTLRMYARHKKLGLEGLTVTLKHTREHLADSEDCLDGKNLTDHIQCDIQITGNLTAEEKNRLLEIAVLCPVHKTMHNNILVTTQLVT